MKAINPNDTSIIKYIHASLLPSIALYENSKYNSACIGLKSFHQILSPKTSGPVCREPVKYM